MLWKYHLNGIAYRLISPFYHGKIRYDRDAIDWAYKNFSSIYPDPQQSSICENEIDDKTDIDLQIIIPAYNVENYIDECIESVLKQETHYKYHITIVEDGSTDSTKEKLSKYLQNELITIIFQKNKGLSGARNAALKHIIGKYIMFLDSDDYLLPGAVEDLLNEAYDSDSDIVQGGISMFDKDKIIFTTNEKKATSTNWDGFLHGYACAKIFKATLFRNAKFPERYWFEDSLMSFRIFPGSRKNANIGKVIYMYRNNPNGITNSSHTKPKSLETYWIAEQLIKDRESIGQKPNMELYESIMSQIRIDFQRIIGLNDRQLCKSLFILYKNLFECHFKGMHSSCHKLESAFANNDYKAFEIYCLLK